MARTATPPDRVYAGATASQRREQRRRALLDAAAGLVRAGGLAAVSYRAVCRASGLSERYFYENFADVDDLLRAVFTEQFNLISAQVRTAVARADRTAQGTIRAAIGCFVEHVAADPLLARLLVDSAAHPALRPLRQRALGTYAQMMIDVSHELYGAPASARARRRNRHIALALAGGLSEVLAQWLDGSIARDSRREIVDDTTEMFVAVVRGH